MPGVVQRPQGPPQVTTPQAFFRKNGGGFSRAHALCACDRYTDTDKDPYTIKKGFWYAHLGWLLWQREPPKSDIRDLQRDPVMRFQDEYYAPLALFQGLILPTAIAGMFWGDWMGGFLIAGTLPPPELCS